MLSNSQSLSLANFIVYGSGKSHVVVEVQQL